MAAYVTARRPAILPIMMAALLVLALFPIYWIVATSFKTPVETILPTPTLFPKQFTLQNYQKIFSSGQAANVWNSFFATGASTLISLGLAFLASYALVRHRFPAKLNSAFLVWIILAKMLPPVVLAVPLYDMFAKMKLLNNLWGLVLVFQVYTLPYCIWMLFGFVKALPPEFEEAAEIDGASRLQILYLVALPLVRTGIAATAIFCVIVAWDEFLFTMLFIRNPGLLTLPLVISNYIGEYETLWGQLMGIGMLATLPIVVFARVVYRQMTSAYSLGLR